jgi:hypothetical protein
MRRLTSSGQRYPPSVRRRRLFVSKLPTGASHDEAQLEAKRSTWGLALQDAAYRRYGASQRQNGYQNTPLCLDRRALEASGRVVR